MQNSFAQVNEKKDSQIADIDTSLFGLLKNEAAIEEWLKENNIPTLGIGIINNSKLQEIKVFGEIKDGVIAPYNTIFNVASLTKPVTAIVVLKLVSIGKWNLDEPIYKYWIDPDVANDTRSKLLTTRHILSHQTGFPNWRKSTPSKKLAFEFTPGAKYQYSGEGYEYLRKALENKFHKTLDQLAKELIFAPLNMDDTRYVWGDTDSTRYANGYNSKGEAYITTKRKTANAADDLLTTVEDYGNFLVSVMNKNGISDTVYKDLITYQVQIKQDEYFGLGFVIYDLGNGTYALSHSGEDKGAQTLFFILPQTGQGLIIFTNADVGYKVYETLIKQCLGGYGEQIFKIETR